MKLIFMGTPDFAVPTLKKISESRHQLLAVVTAPDKERGRGQKVSFTPVKEFALKNNIPVLQPEKLRGNTDFANELKKFNADLFVIVAFRILPEEIFSIPPLGSFNLHASLLPKYRGAAPIQWALINGETETGLTTFKLAEKVDTGNIILQQKVPVHPEDNFGILHDRLSEQGADVVLKTIDIIESGNYELLPQNDSLATPAPKITKDICKIDWNKTADELHNLIRGLSPAPGAWFIFESSVIKVYRSGIIERTDLKPGQIERTKKSLIAGCGRNALALLEVQPENRKRMSTEEFLRGYRNKQVF